MKSIVKVFALVMAVCLVVLVVVSCNGNKQDVTTETTTVETTTKEEVTTVVTTEVTTTTEKVTTTEKTTTEETTTEETTTEETTTEEVTSEETTTEEKEPEYYWLTIQYLDNTDGHQVAPMYRMRYVEGTRVSIVSPTIPGKQAKIPAVVVIMDKDIIMRVYYIDQN